MDLYALTKLKYRLKLTTDDLKLNHALTQEREYHHFDPSNPEHIVSWYHDILTAKPYTEIAMRFEEGDVGIQSNFTDFACECWEYNPTTGDCDGARTAYQVRVQTTLDNPHAKKPKKWLLDVCFMDFESGAKHEHLIEWPRLPSESLTDAGFLAGLTRRNIFDILRT